MMPRSHTGISLEFSFLINWKPIRPRAMHAPTINQCCADTCVFGLLQLCNCCNRDHLTNGGPFASYTGREDEDELNGDSLSQSLDALDEPDWAGEAWVEMVLALARWAGDDWGDSAGKQRHPLPSCRQNVDWQRLAAIGRDAGVLSGPSQRLANNRRLRRQGFSQKSEGGRDRKSCHH